MGTLKQLLPFGNGTLLGHAIDVAGEAGFAPIIVVVGADAEAVQSSIASKPVEIVRNPDWKIGMGSSIHAGVRRFQELGLDSAAIAILVGDQPLITPVHLEGMRKLLNASGASVVAAEYGGTLGVPAFFKRNLISRLLSIPAAAGAKSVLTDPTLKTAPFPLPEAAVDVDTPQEFAALS
jgi:molybdenum cofactor cytidylyltransferase